MLTRYCLRLKKRGDARPRPEWGYRLYAELLRRAPASFGAQAHDEGVTPVSQFLRREGERLLWTVSLLDGESRAVLGPVLEALGDFSLEKDGVSLTVEELRRDCVADTEDLLRRAGDCSGVHTLRIVTPAAFKSRGRYQNLPTGRLLLQSLIKKWNGSVTDCPIEDEDGAGLDALAEGLELRHFTLQDRRFYLKGHAIPGFTGELVLENRLSGFHRQLTDALLLFSAYAGLGVKTTLGMGGVVLREPALSPRRPGADHTPPGDFGTDMV